MNEKGKDQFLIDAQKEFEDFWNEQIGIDEEMRKLFWLFIESKLKEARIDEDKYWIEQFSLPTPSELGNRGLIIEIKEIYKELFTGRISELEGEIK